MTGARILIVEDEILIAEDLAGQLAKSGHEIVGLARTGEEALQKAFEARPDLVLMDIGLPGEMDGIEAASLMRPSLDSAIVYLTAYSDATEFERAKTTDPYAYLTKPVSIQELTRVVDIALYKRTMERRVRESQEKYRVLVEESFDGVFLLQKNVVAFANSRLHTMLGYEKGSLKGADHSILYHPDERGSVDEMMRTLLATKDTQLSDELRFRRKSGTCFFAEVTCKALTIDDEPTVQVWVRDISEQREALKRLKLLSMSIEQSSEGIAVVDLEGRLLFLNNALATMHGYQREDVLGKHVSVFHSSGQMPAANQAIRQVLDTGSFSGEMWHTRKDGAVFPTLMHKSLLHDASGKAIGIVGTLKDITDLKRSESALRLEKQRFQCLAENAPFGMALIGKDGSFQYVNPQFTELFGYDVHDIPSDSDWFNKAYPDPEYRNEAMAAWCTDLRCFGPGEVMPRIFSVRCRDGADRMIHFRSVQLWTGEQLMWCEDITDRIKTESELRCAKDAAESASRAKSEFLTRMSHELRTPLNAVIGFSELLGDGIFGELNPKQLESAKEISSSGRHLLRLINDILDLARVESGKMTLCTSPVDLFQLLEQTVSMIRDKVVKNQLCLEVRIADDLADTEMLADETKLKQVLVNLLENAVKFSPPGGRIRVKAWKTADEVVFGISDMGMGVKKEDIDRIFEPFEQADCSLARMHPGIGLGLALTRDLVELHGGRIWVESGGEGAGSTFSFALPFVGEARPMSCNDRREETRHPATETPVSMQRSDKQSPLKILVVEDNEANMKLVSSLLEEEGYTVLQSWTGEEAIRVASSDMPAAIVMDISLPGADGLTVTRLMKQDPHTRHIPVLAVTAHVMKGDEEKALDAGCDVYVPKPISRETLLAALDQCLSCSRTPSPEEP